MRPRFVALAAAVLAGALLLPATPAQALDRGAVMAFATQALRSGDTDGRAFAIVDKQAATLWVFDREGRLVASTPVLVGEAAGDVAPADIGTRPLSRVKKSEKVTGAGRYETEPGVNSHGEDIVWLDYDSALSMHRVRHVPGEHRPQRLATPAISDNRISFGCINMPPAFYEGYVDLLFRRQPGIVYVLPEQHRLGDFFAFARGLDSAQP